jgi:hypothetical protein
MIPPLKRPLGISKTRILQMEPNKMTRGTSGDIEHIFTPKSAWIDSMNSWERTPRAKSAQQIGKGMPQIVV